MSYRFRRIIRSIIGITCAILGLRGLVWAGSGFSIDFWGDAPEGTMWAIVGFWALIIIGFAVYFIEE